MPKIYKVYISSTYKDLKEQREVAARAVRALCLQTIAMEDYTSTEQKPVKKCQADVTSCDIYIGIFAFRYGFVPDDYDKSITRLEYEAAGAASIPRLLFLIDEIAPWPRFWMDEDSSPIYPFRDFLKKQHQVTMVTDVNQLESKVSEALHHAIDELRHKPGQAHSIIPDILPYLNNRRKQEEELETVLRECCDTFHQKPFIGFIHGDENECHETFIEKLQNYLLPGLLNLPPGRNLIADLRLNWPVPTANVEQRLKILKNQLFQSQTGKYDYKMDLLVQAFNTRATPLLIHSTIHAGEWHKKEPELIDKWLDFWNHLPDLGVGKKLLVFLSFKYRNVEGMNRSQKKKYCQLNKGMRQFIDQLNLTKYENIHSIILSELCCIPYEQLHDWIATWAATYCDKVALQEEISEFYKRQRINAICMMKLAQKLREFCLKTRHRVLI